MTTAVVVIVLTTVAVAVFIARPLFRAELSREPRGPAHAGEWRDLRSQHERLLASLRDLEDDRATDKIGDDDYRKIHTRLSAQAIEVLK